MKRRARQANPVQDCSEQPAADCSTSRLRTRPTAALAREAGPFATVLDPAKIKARKRLFMTATPRYFTGG